MSKDVDNWVWAASISIRYPKWLAVAQTIEKAPRTIPTAQKWTFATYILTFPMTDSFIPLSELREEDMWEYLWNRWTQQVTVFCLPDSVALVIYPNWEEMQAQRNKPPANLPIAFGGTKFSPVERIPHEAQQYSSRLHRKTSVQLVNYTQTQQDIS